MTLKSGRTRLRLLLLTVVAAMSLSAVGASSANAAADHYCTGCVLTVVPNTIISTERHSLTLSYVHYIGSGNRSLCALAFTSSYVQYGNPICGTNTATHSYSGSNLLRAAAANNQGINMTVNAHGTY